MNTFPKLTAGEQQVNLTDDIIRQGYKPVQAKRLARILLPTPAQQRMAHARAQKGQVKS